MSFKERSSARGRLNERIVSLMDDLLHIEPANASWQVARGYYRYRLGTQLAKLGDRSRASVIGAQGLTELSRLADLADATPQALQLASEAYARIEPRATAEIGNARLHYAERFAKLRPAPDLSALYLLAFAQNAEGGSKEAVETARRALALLPPTRNGRVYYVRTELESIR